jgi:hypothetical protein
MVNYDLGNGVTAHTYGYHPDRELNPQDANVPDMEIVGLHVQFADGCVALAILGLPGVKEVFKEPIWDVHSLDPLHIEPSLSRPGKENCARVDHTNCHHHNHHGHIRNGQWQPCPDDGMVTGSG